MTRPRLRIGAELLPVLLILACLAGSLYLIVAAYRRRPSDAEKSGPAPFITTTTPPAPSPSVALPPEPEPGIVPEAGAEPEPGPPPAPPIAPTPAALAELGAEESAEAEAAASAGREAEALEAELRTARAEAARWREREGLMRAQAEGLQARAQDLLTEAETIALERDVLLRRRDALRDDLRQAQARALSSHAVLPYRGPTGTWQRPIAIECRDGSATIQPDGPTFGMFDLAGLGGARSSPFVAAVARELLRARRVAGPDGAPVVPYILFLVRPDGIRPYYEARARLEPLGITFGYELVTQDEEIEVPALDDATVWADASAAAPNPTPDDSPTWPRDPSAGGGSGDRRADGLPIWPTSPPGGPAPEAPPTALQRALGGPSLRRPYEPLERGDTDGLGGRYPGRTAAAGEAPLRPGRVEIFPGGQTGGMGLDGGLAGLEPPTGLTRGDEGQGPAFGNSRGGSGLDQPSTASGQPDGQNLGPGLADPAVPAEAPDERNLDLEGHLAKPSATTAAADNVAGAGGSGMKGLGPRGELTTGPDGGVGTGDPRGGAPAGLGSLAGGGTGGSPGAEGLDQAIGSRPGDDRPWRERTLELVVVCDRQGVRIQPGGERLPLASMREHDGELVGRLREIVWARREAEPAVFWVPRLRFLVEPGGQGVYQEVRRQTIMAGTGWPVILQVADDDPLHVSFGERP